MSTQVPGMAGQPLYESAHEAFAAGAASRDVEVAELRAKYDRLLGSYRFMCRCANDRTDERDVALARIARVEALRKRWMTPGSSRTHIAVELTEALLLAVPVAAPETTGEQK